MQAVEVEAVSKAVLGQLEAGAVRRFADWPDDDVPAVAAAVYTIWRDEHLVYVGMSGRGRGADQLAQDAKGKVRRGVWTRLNSHASGRRSGDQFCIYVADRLVLPTLNRETLKAIAAGTESFDRLNRQWIRANLGYRFAVVSDGIVALRVEHLARGGVRNHAESRGTKHIERGWSGLDLTLSGDGGRRCSRVRAYMSTRGRRSMGVRVRLVAAVVSVCCFGCAGGAGEDTAPNSNGPVESTSASSSSLTPSSTTLAATTVVQPRTRRCDSQFFAVMVPSGWYTNQQPSGSPVQSCAAFTTIVAAGVATTDGFFVWPPDFLDFSGIGLTAKYEPTYSVEVAIAGAVQRILGKRPVVIASNSGVSLATPVDGVALRSLASAEGPPGSVELTILFHWFVIVPHPRGGVVLVSGDPLVEDDAIVAGRELVRSLALR